MQFYLFFGQQRYINMVFEVHMITMKDYKWSELGRSYLKK